MKSIYLVSKIIKRRKNKSYRNITTWSEDKTNCKKCYVCVSCFNISEQLEIGFLR